MKQAVQLPDGRTLVRFLDCRVGVAPEKDGSSAIMVEDPSDPDTLLMIPLSAESATSIGRDLAKPKLILPGGF